MGKKFLNRREAAAYITDKGLHCAPSTLAKLACIGGGPIFQKFGRHVIHTPSNLDIWVEERLSGPLRNTSDLAKKKIKPDQK